MLQRGGGAMWVANLKVRFMRGGLCSLLLLTVAIAGVCQVAHLLKITPLPYRVRRHFAPLVMPSYDSQLDAELAPGEVVHIGIVVPFTVSAACGHVLCAGCVWSAAIAAPCRAFKRVLVERVGTPQQHVPYSLVAFVAHLGANGVARSGHRHAGSPSQHCRLTRQTRTRT